MTRHESSRPAARRRILALALAAASLAACLAGCHGARLTTPAGFANLGDEGAYSYRATSARGVVLATRTEKNDVEANTEFWTEALDLEVQGKGYVREAQKAVKTDKGLEGTQIRYTADKGGRPYRYWMTVFATKSKVYVVEAAGDRAVFDPALPTVERAIASLDATR